MLKSKSVAKLIENQLNKNTKDEKFRVVYEVGSYKGTDINCVLKQGKGVIKPIANYTNVNMPYTLEVIMPVQCGEDRIDNVVDIVNEFIMAWNGKVKSIDDGKAVFLINPLEIGSYDSRATVGQSVIIKLDFNVEYSTSVGTKYEMALITTPFEYGTQNVRKFKDFDEKDAWVKAHVQNTNAPFCEILAPNLNSLVITQQRYLNPSEVDINDLLMHNYAIIKETKVDNSVKYYCYYVTNANIDQYNMVVVDLTMDTLTTFYDELEFGDCFINKADINRWIDNGDGTVSFDTSVNSELFEREDVKDVSKRLVKRDVINKFNEVLYGGINDWLNENVIGWYYVFVSSNSLIRVPNSSYKEQSSSIAKAKLKSIVYKNKSMAEDVPLYNVIDNSFYNTIVCCAFPLMKTNKKIYFAKVEERKDDTGLITGYSISDKLEISNKSLEYFLQDLGSDYVYSLKFSQVPPFKYVDGIFIDINNNVVQDKKGNLLLKGETKQQKFTHNGNQYSYNVLAPLYLSSGNEVEAVEHYGTNGISYGLLNVLGQVNINIDMPYTINDVNFTFKKSEIVNSKHDLRFNPKLLSADYKGLVLSDNLQNGSEYDILKLGNKNLTITYTEALTPDITKKYIRLSGLSGYYVPEVADNLTGYVVSDDTSFIIEGSQYQSMLANNKNFFLQNSINRQNNITQTQLSTITSLGSSLASGGIIGALNNVIGISGNIANTLINNNNSRISEGLTVDNLKNAPNSINGAKGNVIFNAMYSDMGVVVEIYDILPNEKKMIDDSINMNGMTLNKVENIKKYDNMRAYHNYIQANIENIKGNISSPIRDDIRKRFANGIRFWNVDEISYEKENYERWLNNEQ